ncbi:hypothetical protein [Pseudomonas putida]|uniref:hypothetical protein n=1 Tax=Pseudomonas putida TaxID=303 RepID=UPI0037CA2F4A
MNDTNRVMLERPIIPDLTPFDEIDLEALGDDGLVTFIKYSAMKAGDMISPRWVGAGPGGEAFDFVGSGYTIGPGDLDQGAQIIISNSLVCNAAGGWAFYSYNHDGIESQRQFCYIGTRPRTSEVLSVPITQQAHDLVIKPDEIGIENVSFIIPRYQAMQVGDQIDFTLIGYDEHDVEEDVERQRLTVTKDHFGTTPLIFQVRRNWFRFIDPGSAHASYTLGFVDGQKLESPTQIFVVDSAHLSPAELQPPSIEGHEAGKPLDPARFRDGLRVHIEPYPGLTVGDRLVLVWQSPVENIIQPVRVDPSTQATNSILFHLPATIVEANQGLQVGLSYLYAREGVSLRSEFLQLEVARSRMLTAPWVNDAVPESDSDSGVLSALLALGGVHVDVPDVAGLDESIELHWWGRSEFGRYIADSPLPSNSLRFFIPARYVPANMGRGAVDQSRRFEVFYRLITKDGYLDSRPFNLRITPPPKNGYPQPLCDQEEPGVVGGLPLHKVPADGADISLAPWRFAAEGQLLTLTLQSAEGDMTEDFIDSVSVTEEQATTGFKAKLPKALLEKLTIDLQFTLSARLSFDGGERYTEFPEKSITLRR